MNRKINFSNSISVYDELQSSSQNQNILNCNKLDLFVFDWLRKLNLSTRMKGFDQLKTAIIYCLENNIHIVTGKVYEEVAKVYCSDYCKVEKIFTLQLKKHGIQQIQLN